MVVVNVLGGSTSPSSGPSVGVAVGAADAASNAVQDAATARFGETPDDFEPRTHRLQRQDAKSRKTFKIKRHRSTIKGNIIRSATVKGPPLRVGVSDVLNVHVGCERKRPSYSDANCTRSDVTVFRVHNE